MAAHSGGMEIIMKKIGKEVCFIKTDTNNKRNGEGSFIRLRDGSILYAYTRYDGDGADDHDSADIAAVVSRDGGETFSQPFILLKKDADAKNYMSVSLLRLSDGSLGIAYLRKSLDQNGELICMPYFRRSFDDGKTFSDASLCVSENGYYCMVNDSALVLNSGRILLTMPHLTLDLVTKAIITVYSDDLGESWHYLTSIPPISYGDRCALTEPGIYEHADGTLWCWMRTDFGHQYQTHSNDGGKSWSQIIPNFYFTSPDSPMRVTKAGKYAVAVFNPIGYNCIISETESWKSPKRTPLVCAVSEDDAKSFDSTSGGGKTGAEAFKKSVYYIEDDRKNSYCYPAIIGLDDGFLIAYYHSGGTDRCLSCNKIVKVLYDEIDN